MGREEIKKLFDLTSLQLTGDARLVEFIKCVSALSARASRFKVINLQSDV